MTTRQVAAAMERVHSVLLRRPETGIHDDAPATAAWQGATRVVARHANGTTVPTDMPTEVGGTGDQVTPGWLFRAGVASCTATSIAMSAAAEGIELDRPRGAVDSRTDTAASSACPTIAAIRSSRARPTCGCT